MRLFGLALFLSSPLIAAAAPVEVVTDCELAEAPPQFEAIEVPERSFLRFTLDADHGEIFHLGIGVSGISLERTLAHVFWRDATGENYAIGVASHSTNEQLLVGDTNVVGVEAEVQFETGATFGTCSSNGGMNLTFRFGRAGPREFVVLAGSETNPSFSAWKTDGKPVEVLIGPMTQVLESRLGCDIAVRAQVVPGASTGAQIQRMEGCDLPVHAVDRLVRSVRAERSYDSAHQVQWRQPDGQVTPVHSWSRGYGGPGDWALEVPFYETIHTDAQDGDSGVFGFLADVQAAW